MWVLRAANRVSLCQFQDSGLDVSEGYRPDNGTRFQLAAWPGDSRFLLGYRPLRLIDGVWQRFAEEISGRIRCARCPAPKCGRWLLKGSARSDRVYCSNVCKNQVFRRKQPRR